MNIQEIIEILKECKFPDYTIEAAQSLTTGQMYLQARYEEPDTTTGVLSWQYTRRWLLSPEMTKSEVVQTAFKCVLTSMEHKTREWFTYKGKAIFGPHFDVDKLHAIAGDESSFDGRKS